MIVFAIIGLLSTYMLGSSFINAQRRARDAQRQTSLNTVARALEAYINDTGSYPLSSIDGEIIGCNTGSGLVACEWGQSFANQLTNTIYMGSLPIDTRAGYRFVYRSNGDSWQLFTHLDRPVDETISYDQECASGVNCNYGISSGDVTPDTELN